MKKAWKVMGLLAVLFIWGCQSKTEDKSVVTLTIAAHKVEADAGAYQGDFYWAKEAHGDWGAFYNSIEGFEYEEGYEYVLKVKRDTVPNPPQDASALRYSLVEVVSKKANPSHPK